MDRNQNLSMSSCHYRILEESSISALLRMIDRKAPLLMRAGGLVSLSQKPNVRATEEERTTALELLFEGYSVKQIAQKLGRSYDWAATVTREKRLGKP